MRFGSDQNQSSRVRWVWARRGARDLGLFTAYCSRDWDQWTVWPAIGEVQNDARKYNNSQQRSSQTGQTGPCGPAAWWLSGYPGTVPPNFPRNALGVSVCCAGLIAPWGTPTLGLIPQAVYAAGHWTPTRPRPAAGRWRRPGPRSGGVLPCPAFWVPIIPVVGTWFPRATSAAPPRPARRGPYPPGGVLRCPALWPEPAPRPWTPKRSTVYPGLVLDPNREKLLGPLDPADRKQAIVVS